MNWNSIFNSPMQITVEEWIVIGLLCILGLTLLYFSRKKYAKNTNSEKVKGK